MQGIKICRDRWEDVINILSGTALQDVGYVNVTQVTRTSTISLVPSRRSLSLSLSLRTYIVPLCTA